MVAAEPVVVTVLLLLAPNIRGEAPQSKDVDAFLLLLLPLGLSSAAAAAVAAAAAARVAAAEPAVACGDQEVPDCCTSSHGAGSINTPSLPLAVAVVVAAFAE